MADTGTVTQAITRHTYAPTINRMDFDVTSDSGGDVELALTEALNGFLLALVTKPDAVDVPTTYNVTLEDDKGVDIFLGKGVTRSTSLAESVPLDMLSGQPRPTAATSLTLKVANMGNAKKAFIQVLFR
jgi:hypothetical protein